MLPELHKKTKEDFEGYISLYQQNTQDLEELMSLDIEEDMIELDKAWTVKNQEN